MTFNKEAKVRFLKFARSPEATWNANFRDLKAAVTRMATLAPRGRISVDDVDDVDEEIERLQADWHKPKAEDSREVLCHSVLGDKCFEEIDPCDRVQSGDVVEVCRLALVGTSSRETWGMMRSLAVAGLTNCMGAMGATNSMVVMMELKTRFTELVETIHSTTMKCARGT